VASKIEKWQYIFEYSKKRFSKNRQLLHKWHVSTGEMYLTIFLEWVVDHFGLGLM